MARHAVAALLLLTPALPAIAQERTVQAEDGEVRVEALAEGLEHPWALAFLPDGRMLVTERPGRLRLVGPDGALSDPLGGVPDVFAEGQGGLLDVELHPRFAENSLIFLTYAEPGDPGPTTAVARARLGKDSLEAMEVIFRMRPRIDGDAHFGARLAFAEDGNLFVALGERFQFEPAQNTRNHLGTIVRIDPEGEVPIDNPFAGEERALHEIWSYGHRNIQAASIHPRTGALWIAEHGPRGGDKLAIAEAGQNHGWPVVSWGDHYDGEPIPDPHQGGADFAPALHHWTPAIAPSGMAFYTAELFPAWQESILIGSLTARALIRMEGDAQGVREVERLDIGARVRDVAQGPDGAVYLLTDEEDGALLRLAPAAAGAIAEGGR